MKHSARSGRGWNYGLRVWLERDGQTVLGRGRVALLEAIETHRSIRQAAVQLGMSYRRAWLLVQSMNDASHAPLVEACRGGQARGGSVVTPEGKNAIRRYHQLETALRAAAARVIRRF